MPKNKVFGQVEGGVFLLLHNKKTPKKPVFMGFLGIFLFITICAILGLI